MDSQTATALRKIIVFECAQAEYVNEADSPTGGVFAANNPAFATQTIRVPCSGKLQPEHLLKAFENGAHLVVVLTCNEGDCRYLEGRRRIERRVDYVRGLLDDIGLGSERLLLIDGLSRPDRILATASELVPTPLGSNGDVKG